MHVIVVIGTNLILLVFLNKSSQNDRDGLWPTPAYKALFVLNFIKKKAEIGQSIAANKQNKRQFFCQNKSSISEPNFTKSERKVRFGQFVSWSPSEVSSTSVVLVAESGTKRV